MKCAQCGTESPDGKKFCENCGAPLPLGKAQVSAQGVGDSPTSMGAGKPPAQQQIPGFPAGNQPTMGTPTPSAQGVSQPAARRGRSSLLIAIIAIAVLIFFVMPMCNSLMGGVSDLAGNGGSHNQTTSSTATTSTYRPATLMSESEAAQSDDTWTVLFYLCGSDLETDGGLATYNLQELAQSDLGDNVTFVVEAGGAKKWRNTSMDARYLTRASFDSSGFKIVDKLPAASMAISDTLSDFVKWGVKSYPADHYMLVFWDHGAGSVLGVCQDELFTAKNNGFEDTLTISEIDKALDQAGVKFDVIGFDTCLMATMETANVMSYYSDYMVASEETEPGRGWDYVAFPEWLAGHTGTDGALLGKQICDSYYTKCRKYGVGDMATLSVIDLSKMAALNDAFAGVSSEFAQATASTKDLRALYQGAFRSERFGGDTVYNMVDLGDLMNHTSGVAAEYSDDVTSALSDAVVYQVHGKNRPGVSGMSVFYPLDTSIDEFFYRYLDVVGNVPYAQFLAVMYGKYNEIDWSDYTSAVALKTQPIKEDNVSISYEEGVNDDGRLQLEVTKGADQIADVSVEMALYLEEQKTLVYLGTDHNVASPSEGVYVDNFNGQWMTIDSNWVCALLLEHGDGYNLYTIPVKLNGQSTNLIASYSFENGTYEILCTCDDPNEYGMSGKSMRALEEGDVLEFVFVAQTIGEKKTFDFTMGKVTYSDSVTMKDEELGEGVFTYSFKLTDVLGQVHNTDLYVQLNKGDGTKTVQSMEDYLSKRP